MLKKITLITIAFSVLSSSLVLAEGSITLPSYLNKEIEQYNKKIEEYNTKAENLKKEFINEVNNEPNNLNPYIGNPNGKMVMTEFFDYRCKYCRKTHEQMLELVKQFPDLKIYLREVPILGKDSVRLSNLSMAIWLKYPEKHEEFANEIFKLPSTSVNDKVAELIIKNLGLDINKVKESYANPKLSEALVRNIELFKAGGFTGTPIIVTSKDVFGGYVEYQQIVNSLNKQ